MNHLQLGWPRLFYVAICYLQWFNGWWWCCRLTRDGLEGGSLNTVDIYDSIRQTTNDIHKLIKDDAHGDAMNRAHPSLPPPASSVFPSSATSLTSPLSSESRIPTFLHNSTGKPRVKEEMNSFDDQRFFSPNSYLEQVSYQHNFFVTMLFESILFIIECFVALQVNGVS